MAGAYFGGRVVIDDIKGDWCKVRYTLITESDETVGYVRVEDLEIIKSNPVFSVYFYEICYCFYLIILE